MPGTEMKPKPYLYWGYFKSAYDGDTLYVDLDLGFYITHHTTVRLHGINTPELYGTSPEEKELAYIAKAYVVDWFEQNAEPDGRVLVSIKSRGKYGRWIATITGKHKTTLNDDLLRNNLAYVYQIGK